MVLVVEDKVDLIDMSGMNLAENMSPDGIPIGIYWSFHEKGQFDAS